DDGPPVGEHGELVVSDTCPHEETVHGDLSQPPQLSRKRIEIDRRPASWHDLHGIAPAQPGRARNTAPLQVLEPSQTAGRTLRGAPARVQPVDAPLPHIHGDDLPAQLLPAA